MKRPEQTWKVDLKGLVIALTVMLATFVAVSVIAFQQQAGMITHRKLLIQSYHLGGLLDFYFSLLQDAETGEKGFLLSGEERYLAYFSRASSQMSPTLDEILSSPALRADDIEGVHQVQKLSRLKMDELTRTIRLARSGAKGTSFSASSDRAQAEQIRSIIDGIKLKQRLQRKLLIAKLQDFTDRSLNTMTAVFTFAVFALLACAGVVIRLFLANARITERSRDDALEAAQARDNLSNVLASMDEGLLLLDTQSRVTFANQSAQIMFGLDQQALLGKHFHELFAGSTSRPLAEYLTLDSVFEKAVNFHHLELTLVRPDQMPLSVNATVTPISKDGKVDSAILSFFDTTAQRENERRLHAQFEITKILAQQQPLHEAGARIIEAICEQFDWAGGEIWLLDEKQEQLVLAVCHGLTPEFESVFGKGSHDFHFGRGQGIPGLIWETEKPLWIEDVLVADLFLRKELAQKAGLHAAVGVPIFSGQQFFGCLIFFAPQVRVKDDSKLAMFNSICSQVGQYVEHSQTQSRLALSEERYGLVLDGTMDGVWDYDIINHTIFYSSRWKELIGYKDDEFDSLDLTFFNQVHPDDLPALQESIRAHLAGETKIFRILFRIRHKSGDYRWFSGRGKAVRNAEGQAVRLAGASRDVTAEIEARQQLIESERKFKAIFDKQFELIGLIDVDGKLLDANSAAVNSIGVTLEELVGKYLWETPFWTHSEEAIAKAKEAYKQAAAGQFVRFETEHIGPQGKAYVDFSLQPIFDEQGKVVLLIPEGRDITELKVAQEKLNESEAMFRRLTENVKAIFWISSLDGQFLYVSPPFESITGGSVEAVLANPELFFTAVHPGDIQDARRLLSELSGVEVQFRIVKQNTQDDLRWIAARSFPILDSEGTTVQLCGVAEDISDRKEAEKRVSEFYSTVSHELRSPLTSIRGSLGLIESGLVGDVSEEASTFVTIARIESDRLIRLINSILDLRKIEAGKLELRLHKARVAPLVASTIASMSGLAHEVEVSVIAGANCDDEIEMDTDRITQVLTNLISNSIKFSRKNSTVTVTSERQSDCIYFSVKDQGEGIAVRDLPKLFGKFQQLDSTDSRSQGGTGLGLAISKALVEQHGGTIGVESEEGVGSNFWFKLPVKVKKNERVKSL